MANVLAVHSVGNSLMTYLRNAYPKSLSDAIPFDFKVTSTGELAEGTDPQHADASLVPHHSKRAPAHPHDTSDPTGANPALSIDLHYL